MIYGSHTLPIATQLRIDSYHTWVLMMGLIIMENWSRIYNLHSGIGRILCRRPMTMTRESRAREKADATGCTILRLHEQS